MRIFQLVFFFLISFSAFTQDIVVLRKEFLEAVSSKANAEKFSNTTSKITSSSKAEHMAYRGAALIIESKFIPKIEEKKKKIVEGVGFIEGAVAKDPQNIEIRTVRMGIQENTPKIMKYRGKIAEDKAFISKNFSSIPPGHLKGFVEGYIHMSKSFSEDFKKNL
jgi:hypothetical protein